MGRNKPLLDEILVLDLEATCWDDDVSIRPKGVPNEIIEIGLAKLNIQTGTITRGDLWLVAPEESTVSEFCTQLTTWKQEDVERGMSFKDSCGRLRRDFSSKRRLFASWGNYDRRQFERQCSRMNVPYPFGPSHLNVKDLFALQHRLTQQVNTMKAMEILDMEPEGTWHVGRDDAFNIARVLRALLGFRDAKV